MIAINAPLAAYANEPTIAVDRDGSDCLHTMLIAPRTWHAAAAHLETWT